MLTSISQNSSSWIAGSTTVAGAALAVIGGLALGHILGTIGSSTATALLASGAGAGGIGIIALLYLRYRPQSQSSLDNQSNPSSTFDNSALLRQMIQNNNESEAIDLINKNSLDINAQDADGRTLLHLAVHYNRPDIMNALLKEGADTKICDNSGRTPIHLAAAALNHDSLSALLRIDSTTVDAFDKNNDTALALVVNSLLTNEANALLCIGTLHQYKANFSLVAWHHDDFKERFPPEINAKIEKIKPRFLKLLWPEPAFEYVSDIKKGILTDLEGRLLTAAKEGNEYAVSLISKKPRPDCNINKKDPRLGETALHIATWKKDVRIVKILLEKGADPNICTDFEKETPLHFALKHYHFEIANILLENPKTKISIKNYFNYSTLEVAQLILPVIRESDRKSDLKALEELIPKLESRFQEEQRPATR